MSLTMAILMLVGMWLSVAAAMLWGCCASCAGIPTLITCHPMHWPRPSPCAVSDAMPGLIDSIYTLRAMNDKREPRLPLAYYHL